MSKRLTWPGYAGVAEALANIQRRRPDLAAHAALGDAFVWSDSSQGHKFWADVYMNLLRAP